MYSSYRRVIFRLNNEKNQTYGIFLWFKRTQLLCVRIQCPLWFSCLLLLFVKYYYCSCCNCYNFFFCYFAHHGFIVLVSDWSKLLFSSFYSPVDFVFILIAWIFSLVGRFTRIFYFTPCPNRIQHIANNIKQIADGVVRVCWLHCCWEHDL